MPALEGRTDDVQGSPYPQCHPILGTGLGLQLRRCPPRAPSGHVGREMAWMVRARNGTLMDRRNWQDMACTATPAAIVTLC